jgi:hydroxypyruvate reductase
MTSSQARDVLERCFAAAVAGADPSRATSDAVTSLDLTGDDVWIISVGKGAAAMARGARESLRARGVRIADGVVVVHRHESEAEEFLEVLEGDHPVPGPGSSHAAARVGTLVRAIPAGRDVLVLVSGGTTSLIAAPVNGVAPDELRSLFESLLASGADIVAMNALRKRVLRWGAGRLAKSLEGRRVHCLIASDVPGNDVASIGSGPCVPDPLTARDLAGRISERGLASALPPGVSAYLERAVWGLEAETPKPGDACFAGVGVSIVLDRHAAVEAAAAEARRWRAAPVVRVRRLLAGEAAQAGREIARELAGWRRALASDSSGTGAFACAVYSGETTVTLGTSAGRGGRCQELALAVAAELQVMGDEGDGITVLAAGTDGRDGPTDAAGAVVDGGTWRAILAGGLDPAVALAAHDAYAALDRAGALLRTGATGTNVNDLVLAAIATAGPGDA